MEQQQLGTSGLTVSALGYGAMGLSEFYGPTDDRAAAEVLARALDLGITLIDTADMYGHGHNEQLIGAALGRRRAEVRLATKFGIVRAGPGEPRRIDTSPAYVRRACEASLRRLGTEVIDLYYVHRVDPATPIEETMGALADLVRAGKIRHIGLCEVAPATLRRAHAVHPVTALQTEYSLWTREVEAGLLPLCRTLGTGFVAYSPLGRGFLTGTIRSHDSLAADDFRRTNPRFSDDNLPRNAERLATLARIAEAHDARPGQVALAWLRARAPEVVPIPGTKRIAYLEENVAALGLSLTPAEVAELATVFAPGTTQGARYGVEGMVGVNA